MTGQPKQACVASWALRAAQADNPETAWRSYLSYLQDLGFANASYVRDTARFETRMPSATQLLGFMGSPRMTETLRTEPRLNDAGYKIPHAASLGLAVSIVPERDLSDNGLSDVDRFVLGAIKELGLLGAWAFPIVDRANQSYSVLLIDTEADLLDHEQLLSEQRNYLNTSVVYFREGLMIQTLRESMSPDFLSQRERDCLAWTAAGKTTKEIAQQLGIVDSTVNEYIGSAQKKLRASNRAQAAARAMLLGVVSL